MGRILLCSSKVASKPYEFADIGIFVGSYEELCFFLRSYMVLWMNTKKDESLADWIEEQLEMKMLANKVRNCHNKRDMLFEIIKSGVYFNEKEIIEIEQEYDDALGKKMWEKKLEMGNVYLYHKKYERALECYDYILMQEEREITEEIIGKVYHNCGIAYAYSFEFDQAEESFYNAYEKIWSEKSLNSYLLMLCMNHKEEEAMAKIRAMGLTRERYSAILDEIHISSRTYKGTADYLKLQRGIFNKENGQDESYERKKREILKKWKKEFRSELV